MNYLVEIKTEYTLQLTNILSPLIYEGISSIYEDAIKVSKENEELKIFQTFLKKIPKWSNNLLENESIRILNTSGCADLIKDLINAIIKVNTMILTNTENKDKLKINTRIDFITFIHRCYIETARIFYNNPYLFYHKCSQYDLKKNERKALDSVKNAIAEAIRKMLPLKLILQEYLGNSFKDNNESDFENTISDTDKTNLKSLINGNKNLQQQEHFTLKKLNNSPELNVKEIESIKNDDKKVELVNNDGKTKELETMKKQILDSVKNDKKEVESIKNDDKSKELESIKNDKKEVESIKNDDKSKELESMKKQILESIKNDKKEESVKNDNKSIKNEDIQIKKVDDVDIESVSYYKKPVIEDSFSNNIKTSENPKHIFLNEELNIDLTSHEEHIESIKQRMLKREGKNIPKYYKV